MILGIDPGVTGGYALLDGYSVTVGDLPSHTTQHGSSAKVRTELDLHTLRGILVVQDIKHVFIERVAARPGQGTVSMFRFGEASGALYGLLVGLGLAVSFVTPQAWQKHHGCGSAPDAARQRCVQLYPHLAEQFARKKDQHRADALLLAAYGQHTLNGSSQSSSLV